MSKSVLTGRYAKSIFDLANDNNALAKVENNLLALGRILDSSAELENILKNPAVSRNSQAAVMGDILKKADADDLTCKFINLLVKNGRISFLRGIIGDYVALAEGHRGELIAEVTSAVALNSKQISSIEESLGKSLQKKVRVHPKVNEEIIGGLIVRIGSKMLDASVLGKLNDLEYISKQAVANT